MGDIFTLLIFLFLFAVIPFSIAYGLSYGARYEGCGRAIPMIVACIISAVIMIEGGSTENLGHSVPVPVRFFTWSIGISIFFGALVSFFSKDDQTAVKSGS